MITRLSKALVLGIPVYSIVWIAVFYCLGFAGRATLGYWPESLRDVLVIANAHPLLSALTAYGGFLEICYLFLLWLLMAFLLVWERRFTWSQIGLRCLFWIPLALLVLLDPKRLFRTLFDLDYPTLIGSLF